MEYLIKYFKYTKNATNLYCSCVGYCWSYLQTYWSVHWRWGHNWKVLLGPRVWRPAPRWAEGCSRSLSPLLPCGAPTQVQDYWVPAVHEWDLCHGKSKSSTWTTELITTSNKLFMTWLKKLTSLILFWSGCTDEYFASKIFYIRHQN